MMMTEDRSDRKEELMSAISNSGMMSFMCQAPPPPPPPPAPPAPQPQPPPDETDPSHDSLICRDFLRNSCVRPMCRFTHTIEGNLPKEKVNFCHDFQNGKCVRGNCKFIHCSMEEEDEFYQTGKLPTSVIQRLNARNQNHQVTEMEPPPAQMMEMNYPPALPPLPSPHMTYNVPPPPTMTMEHWMTSAPPMPNQREDYSLDLSQRGMKRRRLQDMDGTINLPDRSHLITESIINCHNCSKLMQINAEINEKYAKLTASFKELEEKNTNLSKTVDLLLEKSTKLMDMFTGQGGTPHTSSSIGSQGIHSSGAPTMPSSRITHILNTSAPQEIVITSLPSSIRQDMISPTILVSSSPGYKTTVMRPPFSASGCMDGNVYSTAALGKGLVETGQQLIMTPRCNEIQRPILTSQAILPNNMVLSTSQIQIIPVTQQPIMKSAGNMMENTMVLNAQAQSMSNSSASILISTPAQQMNPNMCGTSLTSAPHQPVMPYFQSSYTHSNKS